MEGLPRHTSTHAAGVVIASEPLVNFVPLLKNDEAIVSQFTMGTLEELGLLKMDFLGLKTLTVLNNTITMIKSNKGITIDLDNIDIDDKKVYKMIGDGKTVGVFQFESPGMTSFMKELKPDCLEDIIAGVSLYRPGPMNEIPRYIKNKNNPSEVEYITPELEPILGVTYGCMVYQEQVMQIVRDLAGYSMGRSDLVRRAMSKKKQHVMEEERKNFVNGIVDADGNIEVAGCIRNGISEVAANKIFDSMMDFASYAFNKSHAAAYAVVAYDTAYLMRYYPTEFIAATLNSVMGINEKVAYYVRYTKEINIEIKPPDINESFAKFTVKGEIIRFGIASVKNVGFNVIESIVKAREEKGKFTSFVDFCNKVDIGVVNKRAVESLIKAGAFDCFNVFRSKLSAVYEKIMDGIGGQRKKNIDGQMSLFADFNNKEEQEMDIKYPDIKEFDKKYILSMEKEMTGLYISGHPLDEYEETLNAITNTKISDIIVEESLESEETEETEGNYKFQDGDRVVIGGIITEVSRKITKKNTMMAFIKVEDIYGEIEIVVFPKVLDKSNLLINEDGLVIIKGRVSIREEEQPKILAEEIKPIVKVTDTKVYVQIQEENQLMPIISEMREVLSEFRGSTPIYICTKKERKKFLIPDDLWINEEIEALNFLRKKFGEQNVKVISN